METRLICTIVILLVRLCSSKNIIDKEIERVPKEMSRFIITDEIRKFYSKSVEVYMSIIDPTIKNYIYYHRDGLNTTNYTYSNELRESYYNSYSESFGVESRYYLSQNLSKLPDVDNITIPQPLNHSEILLRKINIPDSEINITLLVLRDYFFSSFNCDNFDPSFLKFYDINIAVNNNDTCNFDKRLNIISINNSNYEEIISDFKQKHESFAKINRKKRLNSLMTQIFSRNVCMFLITKGL
jgi:hypothetical protein